MASSILIQINDTLTNTTIDLHPEAPFELVDDKTEALDSGTMVCKHLSREDEFIEGDEVTITIDNVVFYRIIETDNVITIANGIYNHEITLVEETAKLTKYVGADRFFNVDSSGAKLTYNQHLEVLRQTVPLQGDRPFTVQAGTTTLLNKQASTKKYENPTLFDNLLELFRGVNAVPRLLRDNPDVLSHTLYNERNNPITLGQLTGQRKQNNLANFALNVRSKAKNLIFEGGTTTSGTWFPSETEGITPRSSTSKYSDTTAQWQINRGIRKVIVGTLMDLEIEFPAGSGTFIDIDLDITSQIVSQEEWEGLPIGTGTAGEGVTQNNTIYHKIGGETINNIGDKFEEVGIDPTIIELLIKEALFNHPTYNANNYSGVTISALKLRIFFQPYFDADLTSRKYEGVRKRSYMLSNQKDKIVDLRRYANVLMSTANQLANGNWIIKKTHDSILDCFELGDYTADNFQIIKRKLIIFQNKVNAVYELSKNFRNLDAQVSVQNTVDPYTIINDDVESNFVWTEYIELSDTQKIPTGVMGFAGLRVLMNGLGFLASQDTPIYHAEFFSTDADGISTGEKITVPALSIGTDDGIRTFMEFNSPNLAGNQLITGTPKELNPILYTDTGGGMVSAQVNFTNETNVNDPNLLPVITTPQANGLIETPTISFYLQPNERFGLTVEQQFLNTEKFILYRGFAENNSLVKELALAPSIKVYFTNDNDEVYDIYDTTIKPSSVKLGAPTIDPSDGTIDVSAYIGTATHNWCLADENTEEIYLAVNYDGTSTQVVYINLLDDDGSINL